MRNKGGIIMKTYQINAADNALLLVKVDRDKIEILNGMNGWEGKY